MPSFRDKLLNRDTERDSDEAEEVVIREEDVVIKKDEAIPSISFSERVIDLLFQSMKLAVVVKLLGRSIGYKRLKDKLINMWKPIGPIQLIDLEENCFIVKLQDDHDYQSALIDGPWVIFGHYLTVQPWTPKFSPENHAINQVIGWIRLPGLPTRYYHKSVIRAIGQVLGEVVRIDYNTESGDRGKFARLAVLIDLSKPSISRIKVDGKTLFVEYEGLPTICYNCGCYGHLEGLCPRKMNTQMPETSAPVNMVKTPNPEAREKESYGPWMQVQRRGRKGDRVTRKGAEGSTSIGVSGGTRFDLLATSEDTVCEPDEAQKGNIRPSVNTTPVSPKQKENETKGTKSAQSKGKKVTQAANTSNQATTAKAKDTIFASPAYKVVQSATSLDSDKHSVVSIQNTRVALRPVDGLDREAPARPTGTSAQHAQSGKENFLPKPPDRNLSKAGVKLQTGLKVKNIKAKPKEDDLTPSEEMLKALSIALNATQTDAQGDEDDDMSEDEEIVGCSDPEH